ncbi:MAG: acylneuraminate cytidylyltransferase family protein [Micavibrio aeruginosavorus]|uniref:Acylneuraminate cytidylyltransferase family protein n=1 Tax=Micavibrio aeruginosavorus TaxID=349221 RepID=A0A2W5HIR9_9BACT|nr:MAG: acylneuraminate cytidylyltransferase family protein [Micavibrio aeruginosavorus]
MGKRNYLPIITARGGSKGLAGKNILPLNGKPLIAYTIEAFYQSGLPGDCYVSTDSAEISEIAIQCGAQVIKRPTELSTDTASSASAIIHAVEELKKKGEFLFTDFILLQPTSPLRNATDIYNAVGLYEKKNGQGSVVSMTPVETHPYKCFLENEDGNVSPLFGEQFLAMPRQGLPNILKQNGAIYITNLDTFLRDEVFCASPVTPYLMDKNTSIDIDAKLDMDMAEFLLKS